MNDFNTEISRQTITINGKTYTADDARATAGCFSRLQILFRKPAESDNFLASLADFLTEWFNDEDTVSVHTSGSTGTPQKTLCGKTTHDEQCNADGFVPPAPPW